MKFKVGDKIIIRGTITDIDKYDRTCSVKYYGSDNWRYYDESVLEKADAIIPKDYGIYTIKTDKEYRASYVSGYFYRVGLGSLHKDSVEIVDIISEEGCEE